MPLLAVVLLAAAPTLAPMTPAEKAEFEGPACKTFQEGLKSAMANVPKTATPDEKMAALQVALKKPDSAKADEWNKCLSYFERGMADFKASSIEIEAKVTLKSLGRGMKMHFEDEKKLCPSSKKPVPADLKLVSPGPWNGTREDWADPAWSCLSVVEPRNQRFQYEVKTEARAQTFEFTARGYPRGDTTLVTWTLSGKVVNGQVELGEPTKK